ncbi:MAG: SigB/SigF/SigG family RNA polymerase sigma factor [Clostridia bacterium]|nr:SigB/SigF/SigG family RNA polymerase sigma factor [Clostridia bacterium]
MSTDLFRRCAQGDADARNQLLEKNLGLVHMVANRFLNRGVDAEDLYQIASVGMIKALNAFNPDFGVQLSTYAVPVMLGEIKRYLRDNTAIKVSRSYKTLAAKAAHMQEILTRQNGREPTICELAHRLSMQPEELSNVLAAVQPTLSLDEPRGDADTTLGEQIAAREIAFDSVDKLALKQIIGTLPQREQTIILLRYIKGETQERVGKRLGISQVQVSRLEKSIITRLRKEFYLNS